MPQTPSSGLKKHAMWTVRPMAKYHLDNTILWRKQRPNDHLDNTILWNKQRSNDHLDNTKLCRMQQQIAVAETM